jgi:soluble P-type ATPase
MRYNIPGQEPFDIDTLILDLNGTLSVGGVIPEGVKQRLDVVQRLGFKAVLFTGNTRNNADELASELGIDWKLAKTTEDKRDLALEIGADTCASIGNGLIDVELTKAVRLGIVTLQAEGVHTQTLLAADIVVPTVNDALELFIGTSRLTATMRR